VAAKPLTLRASIVLPLGADVWRNSNLATGFARVAQELGRGGFIVEVIVPPGGEAPGLAHTAGVNLFQLSFTSPPIVAGPAPARYSESLRVGHQLWRHLAARRPDIVFAPLVGGVLQPALMSRAVGESLGRTSMVLWGEASTAERLRLGDIEPAGPGAVIDDALETTVLRLADAVADPRSPSPTSAPQSLELQLPASPHTTPATFLRGPVEEIVFVGPASGRHGAPEFLAAIERMGHAGRLLGRRLTFLGPWREGPEGLGKAMLGRRARDWGFPFTQVDESRPETILNYLHRPGVVGVFAGAAADDDVVLVDAAQAGLAPVVCAHHRLAHRLRGAVRLCASDLCDLEAHIDRDPPEPLGPIEPSDWSAAFEMLIAARSAKPPPAAATSVTASLCVTHRDRPQALARALQSRGTALGPQVDTVIVDTGSTPENLARATELSHGDAQLLSTPAGARQAWARNLAARHAQGQILVFLDDDNVFLEDGLTRLLRPFSCMDVDVVISNLALYDAAPGKGDAGADLVFMGEAGWAGLLFNAFGDANFAIRRDRLTEIGGFADNDAAAFDWIFFAKAQARGLKFAVLQQPAIGYHRDLGARDTRWRKLDLEEPRRQVLRNYEFGSSSIAILAMAQMLSLPLIE
jgi:hypothetical protein